MPVTPFIPAITAGASALGGYFGSQRSSEEEQALQGGQRAARMLGTMGRGFYNTGTGLVRQGQTTLAQPTSYYQRLLGGNRALASQAVSQPRAAISDVYRGAERSLEQGGVRGAARDVARGELSRQRAGQISSLLTGVQPGAAAALVDIGQTQTGQGAGIAGMGTQATGQAGGLYAGLLGQGFQNRMYGGELGAGLGGFIFDLLSGSAGGWKKGSKNPVSGVGKWDPNPW